MTRVKHNRIWWLGLVVIAAMMAALPTALAQGPADTVVQSSPMAPPGENGPKADGDHPLQFGIEAVWDYPGTSDDRPSLHTVAWDLRNRLLANDWWTVLLYGNSPWQYSYMWENADAWEEDFKRSDWGGTNNSWADSVDFMFYTGHGNQGFFTFERPGGAGIHDDSYLTYQDAYLSWGDRDLEWLAMLSCSVLGDAHYNDMAWTMNGLHLLMGFKNTAYAWSGFGAAFGGRLRANDTFAGAWWYACDTQQPAGTTARILAEHSNYYYYERPLYRYGNSWDNYYLIADHACGSEYPRPAAAINGEMPVFATPPLSLGPGGEADTEWTNLNSAFGFAASGTSVMAGGDVSQTLSDNRELMMDPVSGLFYYMDHNLLYSDTTPIMGTQAAISAIDAKAIADSFLNSNGLMPGDAQYYEVASNTIAEMAQPGRAMGAAGIGAEAVGQAVTTTEYSVIYSRILTTAVTTATGVQAVQAYSVGGPGAKMKVYVNPAGALMSAASNSPAAVGVIGAQGGWRRVNNALVVQSMTPVLTPEQIGLLFQSLENKVALAEVPFGSPTNKSILTHTLFYWEESTGVGQAELFPAYDLTAHYEGIQNGEAVSLTDHTYLPAAPGYMRPYAEIVATSDLSKNYMAGQVFTAMAADATQPLSALGYDASLNFVLGTGAVSYDWYINGADGLVQIGTGRNLNWTVNPALFQYGKDVPAPQTLVLQVTDLSTAHTSQQMSEDSVQFTTMPPVFLPVVFKG